MFDFNYTYELPGIGQEIDMEVHYRIEPTIDDPEIIVDNIFVERVGYGEKIDLMESDNPIHKAIVADVVKKFNNLNGHGAIVLEDNGWYYHGGGNNPDGRWVYP